MSSMREQAPDAWRLTSDLGCWPVYYALSFRIEHWLIAFLVLDLENALGMWVKTILKMQWILVIISE